MILRGGVNSAGVGAHLIPRGSTSTGGGPLLPSIAWVCVFISNGNFRVMFLLIITRATNLMWGVAQQGTRDHFIPPLELARDQYVRSNPCADDLVFKCCGLAFILDAEDLLSAYTALGKLEKRLYTRAYAGLL